MASRLTAGSSKAAAGAVLPGWPSSHVTPGRLQQRYQRHVNSKSALSTSLQQQQHGERRSDTQRVTRVAAVSPAAAANALHAAAATTGSLLEWMQQQGCVVQGVELQYGQGEQGQVCRELKASKDLVPGDVLVSVPLSCTVHYREADITNSSAAADTSSSEPSSSSSSSSSSGRVAALRRLQGSVPTASDGSHGAWQFKMALQVLLHAMDPDSPLQPYIQTLPGVCPGLCTPQVAMLWPSQQLHECQAPQLAADAGSQAYWLEQYARDVLGPLPGGHGDAFGGQLVTQERLGWALAVSMSRAFGFKQLGGYALAPLIDMANHALVSNAEVRYSQDTGRITLVANKQVSVGQSILLNYGSHDNANLLLSYGFVVPDNPADRVRVNLDIETVLAAILQFIGGELPPSGRPTDGLRQWQRTALTQLGLIQTAAAAAAAAAAGAAVDAKGAAPAAAAVAAGSSAAAGPDGAAAANSEQQQQQQQLVAVGIGGQPPVSGPLLAAVRVVLAEDRAAVKSRTLEQLGDWDQPLSTQHEALVMKALVGLCTVLYKAFPTSIQQDKATLASLQDGQQQQQQQRLDTALSQERLLTAVQFRLNQKLLLEKSTKQLIQRLQELAAKE